jgi:hypothetical protein
LSNWVNQNIKDTVWHAPVGFIPGLEGWLHKHKSINITNHINEIKEMNREGSCLHIIKSICDRPVANMERSCKDFLQSKKQDEFVHCHHSYLR